MKSAVFSFRSGIHRRQPCAVGVEGDKPLLVESTQRLFENFFAHTEASVDCLRRTLVGEGQEPVAGLKAVDDFAGK